MLKNLSVQKTKSIYLITFIVGVVLGTLFFNCLNKVSMTNAKIYGNYKLDDFYLSNVNNIDLLKYVFIYRIKEVCFLIVIGMTNIDTVLKGIYLMFLGFKNSILICYLVILKQNLAIIWYIIFMIPHIFIYVLLVYKLLLYTNNDRNIRTIRKYTVISLMVITECLLEAYANPVLIGFFKQYI